MEVAFVIGLIVFALIGAPIFAVLGIAAIVLFDRSGTPITSSAVNAFGDKLFESPVLVTVPLFILAGHVMANSGAPRRLVDLLRAWLGWMPGGLAIVCLVASAFFAAFTGGIGVTIVLIGALVLPALNAERYPERFALGLVTTSGSLGVVFPPSVSLILYGAVAGVVVEKLFLAGLVPGLICVVALSVYSVVQGNRSRTPRTAFDRRRAWKALWDTKWEVLLPIAIGASLWSGALRVHEAAAFAVIYVVIVDVVVYRDVSFQGDLFRIIREAVTFAGAVLIVLACAIGLTTYLDQAEVPQAILGALSSFVPRGSPFAFLLVLNLCLLVIGALVDVFTAIVVVVPIVAAIAPHFGVDPYHLGIVVLLNLGIGYVTPPIGASLFVSAARFERPASLLVRWVLPFFAIMLVALAITTYVPQLATSPASLVGTRAGPRAP